MLDRVELTIIGGTILAGIAVALSPAGGPAQDMAADMFRDTTTAIQAVTDEAADMVTGNTTAHDYISPGPADIEAAYNDDSMDAHTRLAILHNSGEAYDTGDAFTVIGGELHNDTGYRINGGTVLPDGDYTLAANGYLCQD